MSVQTHSVVLRVSEGDPAAFNELFQQFSPKVYGFALKLTHSQSSAEEIVQEVFLKIWVNRRSLQQVRDFPAYLYTTTKNLTFNFLKRLSIEQKIKTEFVRDLTRAHRETEEAIIYQDYQQLLNNAIERLSPQQKLVYSLCHGEGMKYEEAAKRLRISRLTVKTHMQQAIRAIRSHFRYFGYVSGFTAFLFA